MEHHSFPDTSIPAAYGAYSHTVIAGDFVFLSGQTARDSNTGLLIEGGVVAQTRRCIEIVREILSKLELTLRDVVRVTVYLADIGDFDAMNRAYSTEFQAPYPARSTVQVEMPFGALVGVEVTAYRSRKGSAIESKQNDAE
jgi:2-iminobutanoate/2-iminopropanoate deaminase